MKTGLLKIENGQVLYAGFKMELFIPDEYFKSGLAEEVGNMYKIFGCARAYHYYTDKDTRSKADKSTLCWPQTFFTIPSSVTIEKINFGKGEDKYRVFTYYKDDVVFNVAEEVMDASNVQIIYNMLISGKLDIIEYGLIPRAMQLCKIINDVSIDAPAMYDEVMVAEYYRSYDDIEVAARFDPKLTNKGYFSRGINERTRVGQVSTFSAVTFEDINSAFTKADNDKRENKKEEISDAEKNALGLW